MTQPHDPRPDPGADEVWDDGLDRPHEECGVVGFLAREGRGIDVARNLFFCLYALQHRGQESAGIATRDTAGFNVHKGMGLVSQVFREETLKPLTGTYGVGHNRYSTTGASHAANVQPVVIQTLHGPLAVCHNGNVTNAAALREALMANGVGFVSTSDTEVITQLLARPTLSGRREEANWPARLAHLMDEAEGAYSLVVMTEEGIYAMRDPLGMRPLCLGHLKGDDGEIDAYIAVSESSALLTIGAKYLREVRPGEIVRIDDEGITTVREPAPKRGVDPALCIFEYVYFARPDSKMDDQTIHVVRQRMGRRLAEEAPAECDVVVGVPDSSLPSAMAYAEVVDRPYTEGLIKNRYIGRTFIQPSQRMRRNQVRLKFNALRENLEGRSVVLVDDSIVRGTTMGPLVRLLREAGKAKEVHVRIAAPPIRHPCFMGVDLATYDQLIANKLDVEAIRKHVGADSLAYLSVEGLHACVMEGLTPDVPRGHCDACFTGKYPVDVSSFLGVDGKNVFESRKRA